MENLNSQYTWEQVKEKIKESNINITDSDLVLMPGNEDELYERLAIKLSKSREEVKGWVQSLTSTKTIAG